MECDKCDQVFAEEEIIVIDDEAGYQHFFCEKCLDRADVVNDLYCKYDEDYLKERLEYEKEAV